MTNSHHTQQVLEQWHDLLKTRDKAALHALLHPDCVFWSPVVHTPQRGRDITFAYLSAAQEAFSDGFHYLREIVDGNNAVLEFECQMGEIAVNGVDMIVVEGDQIIEFKVMVRPLKAVHRVHENMMAMLEAMKQ
ncbi:MAG: nuclear transport factor 2 family protein [Halieaceae bacterium]|jgi:ketosteroid isomerase-like protein|nr:nuclear transport factor 2 family protein [Halieaceae bacterium]